MDTTTSNDCRLGEHMATHVAKKIRTTASRIHQSSHQTFLVSLIREYIRAATKIDEVASSAHVNASTSLAPFTSPSAGGGPLCGILKGAKPNRQWRGRMRAHSKREDHQLRYFNPWIICRIPFPLREEVGSIGTLAEKRVPGPWQSGDVQRPSFLFHLGHGSSRSFAGQSWWHMVARMDQTLTKRLRCGQSANRTEPHICIQNAVFGHRTIR